MLVGDSALNDVTAAIIGGAIDVHKALGPGLLESSYQRCLVHELAARGLKLEVERALPVVYKNVRMDCGYRIDILVEGRVIVEVKAVERIAPIHVAQMLAYLRLASCPIGLILNFNSVLFSGGIKRVVNPQFLKIPDETAVRAGEY